MDELIQEIVAILQSNGGEMTWEELLNAIDYPKRGRVMNAVRAAKKAGTLERVLAFDAETGLQPLKVRLTS